MYLAGLGRRGGADHDRDQHPVPAELPRLPGHRRPTVTGLDSFPQDVWAPINLVFQVYHLMIDLGVAVRPDRRRWRSCSGCWKRQLFTFRPLLWVLVVTIVLAEAATIAGWWTAEIGRQPWIVWNELRTADAVSPTITGGRSSPRW